MCLQGDGDALAASDLRDKVRRLEVNIATQSLLLLLLLVMLVILLLCLSFTIASTTLQMVQQQLAVTLVLQYCQSCRKHSVSSTVKHIVQYSTCAYMLVENE
jgi:hypothetical protein